MILMVVYNTTRLMNRIQSDDKASSRGRSLARSREGTSNGDAMDVDSAQTPQERLRSKSRVRDRAPTANRQATGFQTMGMASKAERLKKLDQRQMNRMARQGEADRHIAAAKPKHLYSGKRTVGKTNSR